MPEITFSCPKCGRRALSVEELDSFRGILDPKVFDFLKKEMDKIKSKNYRFWLCGNEKCPKFQKVYYETDLKGELIKEIPIKLIWQ
jgi:hypothetical protein